MNRLRLARFALHARRVACSTNRIPHTTFVNHRQFLRSRVRQRQYASHVQDAADTNSLTNEHIESSDSARLLEQAEQERNLEHFTNNILRSHRVPLGTLNSNDWDNVILAIESWMRFSEKDRNGTALWAADQLLQRLQYEFVTMPSSHPNYDMHSDQLKDIRENLFQCWYNVHLSHPKSIIALNRLEELFLDHLYATSVNISVNTQQIFLQLSTVLKGWQNVNTAQGAKRATDLLLTSTADCLPLASSDFDKEIGEHFDRVISLALTKLDTTTAIDISNQLIERMETLKNDASSEGMVLSDQTLSLLENAHFESFSSEPTAGDSEAHQLSMSAFEAKALVKRMSDILKNASIDDREKVEELLPRIQAMPEKDDDLLFQLVDFYLRIGDASNASLWIHQLSPEFLSLQNRQNEESFTLVDRLLEAWKAQATHPRAPWRAEEIFRYLLERMGTDFVPTNSTLNLMLQIWDKSSDAAAPRKVFEWYNQMTGSMNLSPDETSLHIALGAVGREIALSDELSKSVLNSWSAFDDDTKSNMSSLLLEVLMKAKTVPRDTLKLLLMMQSDKTNVPREHFHKVLANIPIDAIPEAVKEAVSEIGTNDPIIYEAAIYSIMKRSEDRGDLLEDIWRKGLEMLEKETVMKLDAPTEFLINVMKIFVNTKIRRYDHGRAFLNAAEKSFLTEKFTSEEAYSSIPLEVYNLLLTRKWYRPENSGNVIALFKKLQSLYHRGYKNLRPDSTSYLALMKAMSVQNKDPDELMRVLHEMVEMFKTTQDESCKPTVSCYNVVLIAMKGSSGDAQTLYRQSEDLLKEMLEMGIPPDNYTLNLVLQRLIKGGSSKLKYPRAVQLFKMFDEYDLQPDSHAYHAMISACGFASRKHQDDALKACLESFGEIRKQNQTNVFTYASLTKSLRKLLREGPASVADKVASSTLKLCCQDGLLDPNVRNAYQSIITSEMWKKMYGQHLTEDNQEPEEWHRQLPKAN